MQVDNTELLQSCYDKIINGQKVPQKDFIQLYQLLASLSNTSTTDSLSQFHQSLTFCVSSSVQRLINLNGLSQISILCERVQSVDKFTARLLKGRKWFLSAYPNVPITASTMLKNELIHTEHICTMCDSLCRCDLCEALATLNSFIDQYRQDQKQNVPQYKIHHSQPFPRYRFTRTKNDIKKMEFEELTVADRKPIVRNDIPNSSGRVAFVLENLLSPSECEYLVQKSLEIGYGTLEAEFVNTMRDNKRALIISDGLADVLWMRIKPFVESDKRINGMAPFGYNSHGKWRPCRLNPCFRFCAYFAPCIGFIPHRDANFVASSEERSCLTCMVYLNEEFEDGTTNFLKSDGVRMDETIAQEMERGWSVEYKLKPKTGMCVLFDHMILHEGSPVPTGDKFIARTDLVFQRYENLTPEDTWSHDPNFQKMVAYYKQAAEEECQGNVTRSSELYERALSIRQGFKPITYSN